MPEVDYLAQALSSAAANPGMALVRIYGAAIGFGEMTPRQMNEAAARLAAMTDRQRNEVATIVAARIAATGQ